MKLVELAIVNKKDFGIFFTPKWVVKFMINLISKEKFLLNDLTILEPACASCEFLKEIYKINNKFSFVGVEINDFYVNDNNFQIIKYDYLLWNSDKLFDIIIGNPPYGIPSLSPHYTIKIDDNTKQKYKKIYHTWYGKYNVYGAFIEKSIRLLKEKGELIFIIPATFMILDDFKKLRKFLSQNGKTEIIYMGNEVFKPEADVTTVILKFTKTKRDKNILYLYDYNNDTLNFLYKKKWEGEVILFCSDFTKKIDEICSNRIKDVFKIKISPRTPEIKNNPEIIKDSNLKDSSNLVPILNGKNLKIGTVIYQPLSGYWIEKSKKNTLRKFFNKPHIVVGLGFRGNGQIGAAYDYKAYPWMGDVYHFFKDNGIFKSNNDLLDDEIVKFLNSYIMAKYVKDIFRNITYHFSITQLKILPLPNKKELNKIIELPECKEIGKKN